MLLRDVGTETLGSRRRFRIGGLNRSSFLVQQELPSTQRSTTIEGAPLFGEIRLPNPGIRRYRYPSYFRLKTSKPFLKSDDIQSSAHFNTSRQSNGTRSVGTKNYHLESNAMVENVSCTRTMFSKRTEMYETR